jgi:hypothetical protein
LVPGDIRELRRLLATLKETADGLAKTTADLENNWRIAVENTTKFNSFTPVPLPLPHEGRWIVVERRGSLGKTSSGNAVRQR